MIGYILGLYGIGIMEKDVETIIMGYSKHMHNALPFNCPKCPDR